MPARASWKGFLQVNRLQVPVKAFTAIRTVPEISLNQLHRQCCQRVRQQTVCPTHGLLAHEDIVSGFEFARNQFLPIEKNELEALQADDPKAIAVDAFVQAEQIDPVYHSGRTYYLVPDAPPGQRPFCVLRDGMRVGNRQAVGRVVISGREIPVSLRPMGRLLAMTVLEFPQRIRPSRDYETEVAQFSAGPQEQQLIVELITAMTDDKLDLADYRDKYTDGLNELIQRRLANVPAQPLETRADEGGENLIGLLKMVVSTMTSERDDAILPAGSVDDLPANVERRTG